MFSLPYKRSILHGATFFNMHFWMEILSVGWKSYQLDGNHTSWMEILPVGWKSYQLDGNPSMQISTKNVDSAP